VGRCAAPDFGKTRHARLGRCNVHVVHKSLCTMCTRVHNVYMRKSPLGMTCLLTVQVRSTFAQAEEKIGCGYAESVIRYAPR
jgi:hypothetical protein